VYVTRMQPAIARKLYGLESWRYNASSPCTRCRHGGESVRLEEYPQARAASERSESDGPLSAILREVVSRFWFLRGRKGDLIELDPS
jgi:hypothetical protein